MNYTQLINKAEDYIERNLESTITLPELSHALGISKYHFHRIFKEFSSETLHHFITRIKMERSAMYLVVNTSISITEIAHKYGYADTSSYIRAFRKHYGISPLRFRNSKKRQLISD